MTTLTSKPTRVWSSVSTSTGLFLPVTAPLRTARVGSARMAVELRAIAGPIEVIPAYVRVTDLDAAWPTGIVLPSGSPSWFSSSGWQMMQEFRDVSSALAGYPYVIFGLLCRMSSGTTRAFAFASTRLELVGRSS
jgi:hypothetical protein